MYAVIKLGVGGCIATGDTPEDAVFNAERNLDASEGALDAVLCLDCEYAYTAGELQVISDEDPLWEVYACG